MKSPVKRKVLTSVLLVGSLVCTACTTAWTGEAERIVEILIPATANIVTLVTTVQSDVSVADMQTIQKAAAEAGGDLQLMRSLMVQYQETDAAAQPGLLKQIRAATAAVQTSLIGILPALHVKDAAVQVKISAVVGILVSELESVAAILPVVSAPPPRMMAMAAREVKKQPRLSANELVSSYNATMTMRTGNAELDRATAGLMIHAHGKFLRYASAGQLK